MIYQHCFSLWIRERPKIRRF